MRMNVEITGKVCIQDSGKTSTGAYETEKLAATVEEKKLLKKCEFYDGCAA